jgi:hypothetical protein
MGLSLVKLARGGFASGLEASFLAARLARTRAGAAPMLLSSSAGFSVLALARWRAPQEAGLARGLSARVSSGVRLEFRQILTLDGLSCGILRTARWDGPAAALSARLEMESRSRTMIPQIASRLEAGQFKPFNPWHGGVGMRIGVVKLLRVSEIDGLAMSDIENLKMESVIYRRLA